MQLRSSISDAAERVARMLLTLGPTTTADIAQELHFTTVIVGRHLEHLEQAGWVVASDQAPYGPSAVANRVRGRGRPARIWSLTPMGRKVLAGHDNTEDFAVAAVRFISESQGPAGVQKLADAVADSAVQRWRAAGASTPATLAQALSADGYAALIVDLTDGQGQQICQHNCTIRSVAAEFPQFCEAETRAMSEALGRNVVRLATMSRGSEICTTLIPNTPIAKEGTVQ